MYEQHETPGTVDAVVGVGDEKEIRNPDALFFKSQKRLADSLMEASQHDERPYESLPLTDAELDDMHARMGTKVEPPHVHHFIECDEWPATCACGKQITEA